MNKTLTFLSLAVLLVLLFVFDLGHGASDAGLVDVCNLIFSPGKVGDNQGFIITELRLPKVIAALFVGASIAISGLCIQNIMRNPLADASILGVSQGAGLGAAILMLSSSIIPSSFVHSFGTGIVGQMIFTILGALAMLFVIILIAAKVRDTVSVLIVGVMMGFITSAVVSILSYFSPPEQLKQYTLWTFGSLQSVTWEQLYVLVPVLVLCLLGIVLFSKKLNALQLGDSYAINLGINVRRSRTLIILTTGLIIGATTTVVGPIAFIGLAVPHLSRLLFNTLDHKVLIPATMLMGSGILILCDIVSLMPNGAVLPINAITSVLGAPIVIYLIFSSSLKS